MNPEVCLLTRIADMFDFQSRLGILRYINLISAFLFLLGPAGGIAIHCSLATSESIYAVFGGFVFGIVYGFAGGLVVTHFIDKRYKSDVNKEIILATLGVEQKAWIWNNWLVARYIRFRIF